MTRHDTKSREGFSKDHGVDTPYDSATPANWRPDPTDAAEALDQLRELFPILNEPTGFRMRTTSTISWVGGTRTFTITPVSSSFDYYISGLKYTKEAAESIVIADTSGSHFIYFDGDTISEVVNPDEDALDDLWLNHSVCGIVYWNATDGAAYILGDERHCTIMSGRTHEWIHDAIGSVWNMGFTLSGYTENSAVDADLTVEVSDGEFYDEDINHVIEDGAAANQYEQQLNGGDAEIPILYRDDVDGSWTEDAATTLPYKTGGTGRLAYNKDDGDGTFSQVEVANNKFVSVTLIATNDWQYPIKAVQGQVEYLTAKLALEGASDEIIAWGDLPTPERVVLYRLILQTNDGYGSTPKAKIATGGVVDFRRTGMTGASAIAQAHSNLTGITENDHHDRAHAILDSDDHSDSVTDAVTRGSIIVGNSTPKWDELPIGAANKLLTSDGTDATWGDLPVKWRTKDRPMYIEDPRTGDEYLLAFVSYPVTFVKVHGVTDAGLCTINIEYRSILTPDVAAPADNILTANLALDDGGEATTTFEDGGVVAADKWLTVTVIGVAGGPERVWLNAEYTVD